MEVSPQNLGEVLSHFGELPVADIGQTGGGSVTLMNDSVAYLEASVEALTRHTASQYFDSTRR